MGARREFSPLGIGVMLTALVACARIAGLSDSDPRAAAAADADDAAAPASPEAALHVTPAELTLPDVACGVMISKPIEIRNDGAASIPYELEIPNGSAFVLRGADNVDSAIVKGIVAPGATAQIAVALTSPRPGTYATDIFVRAVDAPQQIRARARVTGGALTFTPSLIDFGDVRKDTDVPDVTVDLENTGNQDVVVTSFARDGSGDFSLDATVLTLVPGEKKAVPARLAAGPAGSLIAATFSPLTQAASCGDAPKLVLQGTRVNQDVLVNPATLDFGDVACDEPPGTTKTLTISNYNVTSRTFTITLPEGAKSVYTVDPPSGVVPGALTGAGTTTITVRRKAGLRLGSHPESVVVTVTGLPNTTKIATANVTVVGALLEITPTDLTGVGPGGKSFSVKNVGNRFIALRHDTSTTDFTVTATSTLNPSETEKPVVKLKPNLPGKRTTEVRTSPQSASSGAPLCAPPPIVKATGG